ncbi:hypothetical protein AX15_007608 [Amanita polypyramis BW_CC]|nr:hypothetical protein AX15_007608 [Amanita polypyramis BW_CC]
MEDDRAIVWFDIDNTLYSASARISHAMGDRIHAYFVGLGLSHEEASELHHQYYTQYGLALRGLARHHDVDPLDFDRQCDGSLPLEEMINSDPELVKLFEDIDRTKVRVWALTNAYKLVSSTQIVLAFLSFPSTLNAFYAFLNSSISLTDWSIAITKPKTLPVNRSPSTTRWQCNKPVFRTRQSVTL